MSDQYKHPTLAYIQPASTIEPATLVACSNGDSMRVYLDENMLWQLLSQVTDELHKAHRKAGG